MVRRIAPWLAFCVPVAYVGIIFAVVVHEVVGHGLTAILVGGEFRGFTVYPDGGGHAQTAESGRVGRALVLAGGIASDFLAGALLWVAARFVRTHLRLRMTLLILATALFHDGLPYGLWGAILEGNRGDISTLLVYLEPETSALRWSLIALFAVLYPVSIAAVSRAQFRTLEDDLGALGQGATCALMIVMTVLVGVGYATFEWDSLINGAGMYPVGLAIVLQAAIGAWIVLAPRRGASPVAAPPRRWLPAIAFAWLAAALTLACALTWLRHGVAFA